MRSPETVPEFDALLAEAARKVFAGEFDAQLQPMLEALYASDLWVRGALSDSLREQAHVLHAIATDRADDFPRR